MEKRKTLHSTLQNKTHKLTDLLVNRPRDKTQISDLEEEIEQIRANLDYYNDSIKEVQQNIIEIEDAKVSFYLHCFYFDIKFFINPTCNRTLIIDF